MLETARVIIVFDFIVGFAVRGGREDLDGGRVLITIIRRRCGVTGFFGVIEEELAEGDFRETDFFVFFHDFGERFFLIRGADFVCGDDGFVEIIFVVIAGEIFDGGFREAFRVR